MPLSEHEQRLFDQIEQSLAQDAKFASAVRATDPRYHARRRAVIAAVIGVCGFGLLIAGPITKALFLSVIGFVVTLGAMIFIVQTLRHGHGRSGVTLRVVGGTVSRPLRKRRRLGIVDRLEERWRNRPEGQ